MTKPVAFYPLFTEKKHFIPGRGEMFFRSWLFSLLFLVLFRVNSHAADKVFLHFGEPQNHIAVVELIDSSQALSESGTMRYGKEARVKHLGYGFLTDQHLVVPGFNAKRIRNHLSGKLARKPSDISSLTQRRIKIFTQKAPTGAAYIDEIPPAMRFVKWRNDELVSIPLVGKSKAQSVWKRYRDNNIPEIPRLQKLFWPEQLDYGVHFNGYKELLSLQFDLKESVFDPSQDCKPGIDYRSTFLVGLDSDYQFVGIPFCQEDILAVVLFMRRESQYMREIATLSAAFISLSFFAYLVSPYVSFFYREKSFHQQR